MYKEELTMTLLYILIVNNFNPNGCKMELFLIQYLK